ncbi:MAG: flagellar hook assembly protein FlgD [Opitutaceae bacterium]|nr:flagellar hook assembly protein FlgD [Opitutaceae bacterium]
MQISSTSNSSATQNDAAVQARIPKQTLGQDDFLKLITVQLAHQDPMKPMEDTAFIAQMAQFTSLEQTTQLSKEFASLRANSELNAAGGLLGRQVTVMDSTGATVTGLVSAVDSTTTTPRLLIDGALYPYAAVTKVEMPPVVETVPST